MNNRRIKTTGVLAALLVVAGLTVSITAEAGVTTTKTFTIDIDGAAGGAAPEVFAGDTDAPLTATIRNTSSSQSLNSANLTVPAPYVLVAAPADTVPGGPVVELRNLNIAPGTSRVFALTVDVRTCVPATPPPFTITAKQSNDYNGSGNDFYLAAPSDLQVNATGTCKLSFAAPPEDAERRAPIRSAPFDPAGAPVSVSIDDAGGTGRATSATSTVTLATLNPAVPAPGLAGTTSAVAVAGLATFTPGPTLAVSAFGYRLTAASTGLTTSLPSAPFDIVDDQVSCPAGQPCAANATASKNGGSVVASFGTGASGANLLVSLDAADAPAFACAGYPKPAGTYVSQFVFTGGDASDRTGTMASTIPSATRPLNSYEACWAAPYPFTTESGLPAGVQGTKPGTTDPLYVGLLPDCAKRGAPVLPCVAGRTFNRQTSTVTVTVASTGDDPWRY